MIEIMIAFAILTIGLTSVLGYYQNLRVTRADTKEKARAQDIGRSILDRIAGGRPEALGTATPPTGVQAATWSLARFEDPSVTGDSPPLTPTAVLPADNLIQQEFLDRNTGVTNLRVYIEYYRGLNGVDPNSGASVLGVMSYGYANRLDYAAQFKASNAVWLTNRRLNPAIAPYLQVAFDEPFVVRIIVTWGDRADVASNQRLEFFTAKRRSAAD